MSDWTLVDAEPGVLITACDRDQQPRSMVEFLMGTVVYTFTGKGLPMFLTLLYATMGSAADTELEYYS